MDFFYSLKEISFPEVIDILLMAILIYAVLVWFKRKKAVFVLSGIIICGIFYLLAYQLNLYLITYVLRAFFAVILIAVIVIFRDELRDLFEQIALWSIRRRSRTRQFSGTQRLTEILVRTINDLAKDRVGALIVLRGKNMLARRIEGGVELNGELSEALLKSLFDPSSMGHDGAVLIEEARVRQFGCHLPLSKDFNQLKGKGTRHAAALGLAEHTDAMSIVVSEERGSISVAYMGQLMTLSDSAQLTELLETFYDRISPTSEKTDWKDAIKKNYWEKAIAVGLAVSLWFVLVHESNLVHRTFSLPVEYPRLGPGLTVSKISPEEVKATFLGPRNSFHFINEKNIRLTLPLIDAKPGISTVPINNNNISYPQDMTLEKVEPNLVRVTIKREVKEAS